MRRSLLNRSHTLGGWILLETMTVLLVATIVLGALADVWTAQVRAARIVSERLERERLRTAACLYAWGELTANSTTDDDESEDDAAISATGAAIAAGTTGPAGAAVESRTARSIITIADEIRRRYPELEVTVDGTVLRIDGERFELPGGSR